MSLNSLDDTLNFIANVQRAQTPSAICDAVLQAIKQYGFENILAGTIPRPGANKSQQESHVILHHWPAEWWERYFSNGYLFVDPAIRRVMSDISPFLWSELSPTCRDDPMAIRVMKEAADFGLRNGFTVPLITLEGDTVGFSIAGGNLDIPPYARGMLSLLATYALGSAFKLHHSKREQERIRITKRERDILQWAATGKTEWEIGEILGISEHAVDKFFRNIRHKLNATNRTHAIAEAIRLSIIN
jgi:LuxR family transcriptional regulator, quorum-sensing system regulator BjaR1